MLEQKKVENLLVWSKIVSLCIQLFKNPVTVLFTYFYDQMWEYLEEMRHFNIE